MINTAHISLAVLLVGMTATSAFAEGGCSSTGNGPEMLCLDGTKQVKVMKPFRLKNGPYYSFDQDEGGYCYQNEYGLKRCMQNWETKSLRCTEAEGGQLRCD